MTNRTVARDLRAALLHGAALGVLSGAALVALPPAAAFAQSQAAAADRVVVTARRRAETYIEVPASVAAFTLEDIESAGIETAGDFIALTPNVTLVETQNAGTAFVTIRGISQARNSEPSVAVIIDGVQQTNPSQFTQELVDIQQIEVLRGPQGALYGRNAIGGAINITTRGPTPTWEGRVLGGVDNGFGYRALARASGPLGERAGFSGGISWHDTKGNIRNAFLNEKVDPVENLSGRARIVIDPTDNFTIDLRGSFDLLETGALYFVIDPNNDSNNTSIPITANNLGVNERDIYGASMQLRYETDFGSFISTTAWDSLEEVLYGDQFDFTPRETSFNRTVLGIEDWTQSQFLDVRNISQEFRFASPGDRPVRYSAGAYMVWTDRFISTGNMEDTGAGAFPAFRTPSTNPANPQVTWLADGQDNFAWALFGDLNFDLTPQWELALAARYDRDKREQTTLTPPAFLTALPSATFGEVRTVTFDQFQPKVTLRYTPNANASFYAGYSRGFRSGGFNQSGVGFAAANNPDFLGGPILGVGDIFLPEVVDTFDAGFKTVLANGRLRLNGGVFHTDSENSYFFVFLASNSTQNLGNVAGVRYMGFELDGVYNLTNEFSVNFGLGVTDSKITDHADPAAIGNKAPLVSDYTLNLGFQYLAPLGGTGLNLRLRGDYQRIGDTYWEPFNVTRRDPIDLVDARVGIEGADWALTVWAKNLFDKTYNAEFSPGGFLFRAQPRRYGVELSKRF